MTPQPDQQSTPRRRPLRRFIAWAILNTLLLLIALPLLLNLVTPELEALFKDLLGDSYQYVVVAVFVCCVLFVLFYAFKREHRIAASPDALPADPARDSANRQVLLADMQRMMSERLEVMQRLLKLRFAERPGVIEPPGATLHPYDLVRRRPDAPDELLPAKTTLMAVYDEHQGQLLILGAPGSGKSVQLFQLAQILLNCACQDTAHPVPVVFSLATWREGQGLVDWMVAELQRRYPNDQAAVQRLVEQYQILPLLDGLDEVETLERRGQCVAAINAYTQRLEGRTPLVITCRTREYDDLPALKLYGAVAIQPLRDGQINGYLRGARYAALRAALSNDAELHDAARTPLLLEMMVQTYQHRGPTLPPAATGDQVRQVIMGDYVAFCCAPAADLRSFRVPVERLRAFLGWLARGMLAHGNQQEFYIEFLQPTWLRDRHQIRRFSKIELQEQLPLCLHQHRSPLINLLVGLLYGPFIGLFAGLLYGLFIGLLAGLLAGLAVSLLINLVSGLLECLYSGSLSNVMDVRTKPNQGIHRTARNALVAGLAVGLFYGLGGGYLSSVSGGLGGSFSDGLVSVPFVGLFSGLLFGGSAVIDHYILRLLLAQSGAAPLHLVRILEEARKRRLLVRVGGGYRFYHRLLQDYFADHREPGQHWVAVLGEERNEDG